MSRALITPTAVVCALAMNVCAQVSFASSSRTQEPSEPVEEAPLVFDDVIEVRVVELEVVVTDRSGSRVSGLQAGDFRLLIDGRTVPLDYFTEIDDGTALPRTALQKAPGIDSSTEVDTAREAVGNHYLLYVDDNHTSFADRRPVLEGIRNTITQMSGADRMSIVALSGIGVQSLIVGSQAKPELEAAIERLMTKEFGGRLRSTKVAARREAVLRRPAGAGDISADGPQRSPTVIQQNFDLAGDGGDSFEALRNAERRVDLEHAITGVISTLRAFREVPGRKTLLLLAGDWPTGAFDRPDKATGTITDLEMIRPMIETANLLGYTIYPIGLSGAKQDLFRKGVLDTMAEATGGETLLRVPTVLTDVIADTASYYSLGFVPRLRGDDARHDVRVDVMRPGLEVRARAGYVDLSQSAQLTMSAQTALLFGNSSTDSNLKLVAGRATRTGFRKMRVPFQLLVPVEELVFIQQRNEKVAAFEVRLAVIDEGGTQLDRIPTMPITLRGEPKPGEVYKLDLNLEMRRRPHILVVSLYDRFADASLTKRMQLSFRSTRSGGSESEADGFVQLKDQAPNKDGG